MFTEKDSTSATFTNLADFDFTPEMGAKYNGRAFPLPKGARMTTNLTIAEHLASHLAKQVLLRKSGNGKNADGTEGRAIWDPKSLDELASTYVKKIGMFDTPGTLSKEEYMIQETAKLNAEPELAPSEPITSESKNKVEIVAELKAKNIPFDARASKENLEKLLNASEGTQTATS